MHRTSLAFHSAAVIGLALCFAAPRAAAQGDNGFLRGAGKADLALTYSQEEFDQFWVGSTKMKAAPVGTVTRTSGNLWAAYGVRDDLDIVGTLSYVAATSDGTGGIESERNWQDSSLGLKYRVAENRLGPGAFSFLAAPSVKIPVVNYTSNDVTAIGDGQTDYRGRLIAQYRFDIGAFIAVESGYDYRTHGTPDEVPLNISVGMTFFDRVTVTPWYMRNWSRGHDDIGQVAFPDVAEQFERWGISLYGRITDQVGVTVGYKDTIDGQNTGDSHGYSVGLVVKV